MMVKTHLALTTALALAFQENIIPSPTLADISIFAIGAYLGTVLPDIDEPNSYIGKRSLMLSDVISTLLRHRGLTHFLIVPGLIWLLGQYFGDFEGINLALNAVAFGWLSHIIGDILVGNGIRGLLFPIYSERITLYPMNTVVVGGIFEFALQILLSFAIVIQILQKML